jgi:hypothetical protein
MQARLAQAILAVALASSSAKAEPGLIDIIGAGVSSCGKWTADQSQETPIADDQWILGFLSGVAFMGSGPETNPLNGLDAQAVWAWIDNYCQAHPLDSIATAGIAFFHAHPH